RLAENDVRQLVARRWEGGPYQNAVVPLIHDSEARAVAPDVCRETERVGSGRATTVRSSRIHVDLTQNQISGCSDVGGYAVPNQNSVVVCVGDDELAGRYRHALRVAQTCAGSRLGTGDEIWLTDHVVSRHATGCGQRRKDQNA